MATSRAHARVCVCVGISKDRCNNCRVNTTRGEGRGRIVMCIMRFYPARRGGVLLLL